MTWEFALRPVRQGTRLLVRARMSALALGAAAGPPAAEPEPVAARVERVMLRLPKPLLRGAGLLAHRIMQARQLRGIKRRVERGVGLLRLDGP